MVILVDGGGLVVVVVVVVGGGACMCRSVACQGYQDAKDGQSVALWCFSQVPGAQGSDAGREGARSEGGHH